MNNIGNITLSSGIMRHMANRRTSEYIRDCLDKFRVGDGGLSGICVKLPKVEAVYKEDGFPFVDVTMDSYTGNVYVNTSGDEVIPSTGSHAMQVAIKNS